MLTQKKNLAFCLVVALSLTFAAAADATIVGATYNYSTSTTGNTAITGQTSGTATDPGNPGFCVGPPNACSSGAGVSGSFTFANVSPTQNTITFTFYGSTSGAGPGSFSLDLSNFVTTDGESILGVSYASGALGGATSAGSWAGGVANFTFSTGSDYDAIGGNNVVFNVATAVPEPNPLFMLMGGLGLLGLGLIARRKLQRD
ncbi:MAG: PEP-CTERM sorting domain-containing protein [Terriglobia bacterium]